MHIFHMPLPQALAIISDSTNRKRYMIKTRDESGINKPILKEDNIYSKCVYAVKSYYTFSSFPLNLMGLCNI
ncbi:hypothetical protein CW304_05070 [Bacillus sp. UFRGS-B20]|nr:hypothetical protein CW304_05070 [Bacillus sp. UFRGS-B20]